MRSLIVTVLGGVFFAGATFADGDRESGRKVAGMCRTCHGLDGYAKIPIAPHIGGEPALYLAAQLEAFRDGTREHEMMSVVARSLSDAQIADVSAWYAGHIATATLSAPEDDAPEACIACHGANGMAEVEDAPNLAAEVNIYIDTQLKAFRSGDREHEVMSPIAAELSDDDIRAIADWYGAVSLEIETVE